MDLQRHFRVGTTENRDDLDGAKKQVQSARENEVYLDDHLDNVVTGKGEAVRTITMAFDRREWERIRAL